MITIHILDRFRTSR